jgi:hypothetical protein
MISRQKMYQANMPQLPLSRSSVVCSSNSHVNLFHNRRPPISGSCERLGISHQAGEEANTSDPLGCLHSIGANFTITLMCNNFYTNFLRGGLTTKDTCEQRVAKSAVCAVRQRTLWLVACAHWRPQPTWRWRDRACIQVLSLMCPSMCSGPDASRGCFGFAVEKMWQCLSMARPGNPSVAAALGRNMDREFRDELALQHSSAQMVAELMREQTAVDIAAVRYMALALAKFRRFLIM